MTKATLRALNANPEARVAVLGDKPKAQLARSRTDDFVITFNQIGRDIPTFAEAAAIADEIKTKGGEWDVVKIIYNKYISAISYEPTELVVTNAKSLNEAGTSRHASPLPCLHKVASPPGSRANLPNVIMFSSSQPASRPTSRRKTRPATSPSSLWPTLFTSPSSRVTPPSRARGGLPWTTVSHGLWVERWMGYVDGKLITRRRNVLFWLTATRTSVRK